MDKLEKERPNLYKHAESPETGAMVNPSWVGQSGQTPIYDSGEDLYKSCDSITTHIYDKVGNLIGRRTWNRVDDE